MLNLHYSSAYQYSRAEKKHLRSLRAKYGRHYQLLYGKAKKRVWYDGENKTTRIKHKVVIKLLTATRFRCTYCEKELTRSGKPVDHFLPNSIHTRLSFHPLNLLPSCDYCNSALKKTFDPIVMRHRRYSQMRFSIVHPLLDDVDQHIFYSDPDNTILDTARCTVEGKASIRLFELASYEMMMFRMRTLKFQRENPLTDDELKQLVIDCATYKPN